MSQQHQITRICCFSPCLEQVLKTVTALRAEGFEDVTTKEVLVRTHDLIPPPPPAGSHLHDITSVVRKMKEHETRKEQRRIIQMKTAREKAQKLKEKRAAQAAESPGDVTSESLGTSDPTTSTKRRSEADDPRQETKRVKLDEVNTDGVGISVPGVSVGSAASEAVEPIKKETEQEEGKAEREVPCAIWSEPPSVSLLFSVLTKPAAEMRGHTSYLTFASFYPSTVRQQLAAQDGKGTNGADTPKAGRVGELRKEAQSQSAPAERAGSEETEYGDVMMDEVMGTMTEAEIMGEGRAS